MGKKSGKTKQIVRSSGNVLADLKLPQAEEKKTKVRLAVEINRILEGQGISQKRAARRLKVNQPKISALWNYRLDGFSVERLMNFITTLDRDVNIVIQRRTKSGRSGRIQVTAA